MFMTYATGGDGKRDRETARDKATDGLTYRDKEGGRDELAGAESSGLIKYLVKMKS